MAAYYTARGVEIGNDPLREVLLFQQFQRERLLRFSETMCLVAASSGNAELTMRMVQQYEQSLFPERGNRQEDFETRARKILVDYRDRAFVLDTSQAGGAALEEIDKKDVKKVHEENRRRQEEQLLEYKKRWFKKFGKWPEE